jgi:hypothetical protein
MPRHAGGDGDLGRPPPEALVGRVLRGHRGDRLGRVERVRTGRGGGVEALVIRYGGVFGLGAARVEVGPDEVDVVRAGPRAGTIELRTALTIDDLDARPEADAAQPPDHAPRR